MRKVLRTSGFEDRLNDLARASAQLPLAIVGIEFVLERLAHHGMAVGDTRYSSWPVHLSDGETFKVIYTYDDEIVSLVGLLKAVAPPEV